MEDESDLDALILTFELQGADSQNSIHAHLQAYDRDAGMATITLEATDAMPNGTWILTWIYAVDQFGNTTARAPSSDESKMFTIRTSQSELIITSIPQNY